MGKYLLGIDGGTSVVKCCVIDLEGNELGTAERKIPIDTPKPGWTEEDMGLIWKGVTEIVPECLSKVGVSAADIAGIGVTGQGDGNWYVDKDGEPMGPAVIWTDSRSTDILNKWMNEGRVAKAFDISGWAPYTGSANAIMRWNIENRPDYVKNSYKNLWCKDWIDYRLTGTMCTDETEACPFSIDVAARTYSDELIKLYEVEDGRHLLPDIMQSLEIVGSVTAMAAAETGLQAGTPVVKGMFDLPATAAGVGAVREGDACTVLGTTCANQAVCPAPAFEPKNAGFNICHGVPNMWIRAMGINYGTPNVDWFLRNFGDRYKAEAEKRGVNVFEVVDETLLNVKPGSGGIIYSPYLCPGGERAPFVKPEARAQFFGLTEEHTADQMLRAVYEGVGFSMMDAYENIPVKVNSIRLSGGGAKSSVWCQLLADMTGSALEVPFGTEFGAKGVALFAGVATGAFSSIEDAVDKCVRPARKYEPDMALHEKYVGLYKVYRSLRDDVWNDWDALDKARKAL